MYYQQRKRKKSSPLPHGEFQKYPQLFLSNLEHNLDLLKTIYKDCTDIVFRPLLIGNHMEAVLVYIEGFANVDEMDDNVLAPLIQTSLVPDEPIEKTIKKLSIPSVTKIEKLGEGIESISVGNPLLLIEGKNQALSLGLAKWEKRSIEEPSAEGVVRGPRDGFVETLGVNITLIRRRIKSPDLKMVAMKIGHYTQTKVVLSYIEGLADPTLIEEVNKRLQRIKIDGILESGYIEEMIEDNPFSPFPQMLTTERPDVASAHLLEGRAVILVDETPFVLIAPITFFSMLQSAEDYYQRFLISTAIRWLRYLFLGISLLLPSLYVAVLTFHQEMAPTALLISIAASRELVPFPALVEALIMEITFEALREAGVRLPKQIGAAVSIVGALVIGQAAVQAGLVSAPMVIVVAVTGTASFMIPRYVQGAAFRMLRFPIMLLAGSLGLLGVMLGIIGISIHLCTLRSFGVPYLTPIGPMKVREWKDVLIRAPWWMLNKRPHLTGEYNSNRQSPNQKPGPQQGGD
jgi:hypothetical protein